MPKRITNPATSAIVLKTQTFNEFAKASNFTNQNFNTANPHSSKPESINRDWIPFRNNTGRNLTVGQVVGLDDALITPETRNRGFFNSVSHAGVIPTFINHRDRAGIVMTACPAGKIGDVVVSGMASVFINIKAEHTGANLWRPYASVVDNEHANLDSDPSGNFQIIWTESGGASHNAPTPGVQECRVLCGSHYHKLLPATVGPSVIASGNGGVIQLVGVPVDTIGYWTHATNGQDLQPATPVWVQQADDGMWDIISPATTTDSPSTNIEECLCDILSFLVVNFTANVNSEFSSQDAIDVRAWCTCNAPCNASPDCQAPAALTFEVNLTNTGWSRFNPNLSEMEVQPDWSRHTSVRVPLTSVPEIGPFGIPQSEDCIYSRTRGIDLNEGTPEQIATTPFDPDNPTFEPVRGRFAFAVKGTQASITFRATITPAPNIADPLGPVTHFEFSGSVSAGAPADDRFDNAFGEAARGMGDTVARIWPPVLIPCGTAIDVLLPLNQGETNAQGEFNGWRIDGTVRVRSV